MTRTLNEYPDRPGQDYPVSEAVISEDDLYRYVLNRRWSGEPVMPWICLNPSTADADADDPSIRRMCGFARREGCGGICVLNLYALRSPDPAALDDAIEIAGIDPVGPDNDKWIAGVAAGVTDMVARVPVVAAWGANKVAAARVPRVLGLLGGLPLVCLGVTASGAPRHPLYVRSDAPLIPWEVPS